MLSWGDSITEGCFELIRREEQIEIIRDKNSGYPILLKQKLEKDGIYAEIINAGISGNSAADGLARVKRDVLDKSPDIVVVCFGLNDVFKRNLQEYETNLRQIFMLLKNAGLPVIYMTPNMLNSYVHKNTLEELIPTARECCRFQNEGVMDELVRRGKYCAEKQGCIICDCYESWKRLASDGVDTTELLCNYINHPAREMHHLFADMLYGFVKRYILNL